MALTRVHVLRTAAAKVLVVLVCTAALISCADDVEPMMSGPDGGTPVDGAVDGGDARPDSEVLPADSGTVDAAEPDADGPSPPPLADAVSVSAGGRHACALLEGGRVACWGRNAAGQLGDGTVEDRAFARTVPGLDDITQLSTGGWHTCGLADGGVVVCWGGNTRREFGLVGDENHVAPIEVVSPAIEVSAGVGFTCIATGARAGVQCAGTDNSVGQLGFGSAQADGRFRGVTAEMATNVQAGEYHTCAFDEAGRTYCWGLNNFGQLGLGDTIARYNPSRLDGSGYVSLALGESHTCAVSTSGGVSCWGLDYVDNVRDELPRERDDIGMPVTAVSAAGRNTCVLREDGSVLCWGPNERGQLGDGTVDGRSAAAPVMGLANVTAIAVGGEFACAIADGLVKCWGRNDVGQLGDGTTEDRRTPVTTVQITNADR